VISLGSRIFIVHRLKKKKYICDITWLQNLYCTPFKKKNYMWYHLHTGPLNCMWHDSLHFLQSRYSEKGIWRGNSAEDTGALTPDVASFRLSHVAYEWVTVYNKDSGAITLDVWHDSLCCMRWWYWVAKMHWMPCHTSNAWCVSHIECLMCDMSHTCHACVTHVAHERVMSHMSVCVCALALTHMRQWYHSVCKCLKGVVRHKYRVAKMHRIP